ncbi:hypothetical protein [Bifidobacterium sp. SO1]|uniref:hypothetical protein n=1 Tax=Bifidobacterium sp. SO1 TaxID=2809029 RepID=UPI001BDC0DE5|nr:hypothetical protein [Bifidobacterium sp. SO1]MBT1160910.1 hypothetical protein [Bifidobacterium sp. SO1]
MSKPRERNKVMRQLAADALEAEFEALKQRRAALAELGVQLDDMRYAIDEFRTAAATLEKEQSISRSYIAEALQMTSREKAAVWPPKSRKERQGKKDDSTDGQSVDESVDAVVPEDASGLLTNRSDDSPASYSYASQPQY